jgi:hypothetical protein
MKKSGIVASMVALFGSVPAAARPAKDQSDPFEFNISLSDDITGENRIKPVRVNGGAVTLGSLFAGQRDDRIFATSLQAVNPGVGNGNVLCAIINPLDPENALRLNSQSTFVDFDCNNESAAQIDVTDFTVACEL